MAECNQPLKGWTCSRGAGHKGPCAALPTPYTGLRTPLEALQEWIDRAKIAEANLLTLNEYAQGLEDEIFYLRGELNYD